MILFLLLFPAILFGEDLKTLLEFARQNNNLLNASKISVQAKVQELNSVKSSYYPVIDATTFYKRDDDPTPFYPGTTYGATAKISFNIYDGGKKAYTKKQKNNELTAQKFSHKENTKLMFLNITKEFFNLKTLYSSLQAKEEASKDVKAQLERVQHFFEANLATSDDVDKLQSAYARNIYDIESLKFKIYSLKSNLELQVGKKFTKLDSSKFKKSLNENKVQLDSIEKLKYTQKALRNLSQTVSSYYYPNINIADSYTVFGYEDKPSFANQPIPLLDKQNEITATLSMRLFDFGTLNEQKEALKLQADALNEKIIYKTKEQQMQLELSLHRIKTTMLNIESSKIALKSSTNALKTITKKYEAGIVDNITYLDALSSKTQAKALYEKSLNDLEIAYAIYYYYNSKNLEDYLKWKKQSYSF